jgi:hypothetical protein
MIGDGMGRGQLAAAKARAGSLFMSTLPNRGELTTGSLSGITDSAAAATTMATGVRTFNTRIGMGPEGEDLETLVDLARKRGMHSGVVTTAYLSHATPGAFTAYRDSRHDTEGIAADQALVGADIMFGGGHAFLSPHFATMQAQGYKVITTSQQLEQVQGEKVLGVFSEEHMDYVIDRSSSTTQPTLSAMSIKALDLLEASDDGYFLMIEGARIDMASHLNDFERALTETVDFDKAVEAVAAWAATRPDVLLLVTADHECGGLALEPEVSWRWEEHTNARVDIFGSGSGSEIFNGELRDHRWVHAALAAQLTGEAFVPPPPMLVADGHLADMQHQVAQQTLVTDFGPGLNQLDSLWVDADERGLALGVEGVFQWDANAVAILVDVDYGAGTGMSSMSSSLSDVDGTLDAILSALRLTAPTAAGFGADLAIGSWGGLENRNEDLLTTAGGRGFVAPLGQSDNLGWLTAVTNFGEGVRTRSVITPIAGEGFEAFVPWTSLYPTLAGGVPVGATIAIAAVLVNDDGGYTSNQALPPFPATVGSPARTEVALPGVVRFVVDSNQDGIGDGASIPVLVTD